MCTMRWSPRSRGHLHWSQYKKKSLARRWLITCTVTTPWLQRRIEGSIIAWYGILLWRGIAITEQHIHAPHAPLTRAHHMWRPTIVAVKRPTEQNPSNCFILKFPWDLHRYAEIFHFLSLSYPFLLCIIYWKCISVGDKMGNKIDQFEKDGKLFLF